MGRARELFIVQLRQVEVVKLILRVRTVLILTWAQGWPAEGLRFAVAQSQSDLFLRSSTSQSADSHNNTKLQLE
jgi:hypothetical protein